MANAKITPEVEDVLRRSTLTGNTLVLPQGQLPRDLYLAVNKVLENAGGKWKRGTGHVFPADPREKLGLALATGTSIDEKKKRQAFYTPPELARHVVALADVGGMSVLEPSCGAGALVAECVNQGAATVVGVEVDKETVDASKPELLNMAGVEIHCADFMKPNFLDSRAEKFDRVVMNPPFAKGQDIRHAKRALEFLKPDGKLVAVMWPESPQKTAFAGMVGGRCFTVENVEAGTFKESGTATATIIVTILN